MLQIAVQYWCLVSSIIINDQLEFQFDMEERVIASLILSPLLDSFSNECLGARRGDMHFHKTHLVLSSPRSCLCLSWCLCFPHLHSLTSRAEFPSAKAVMDGFGGADLTISKLIGRKWSWRFTKVLQLINIRTLWVYWGCMHIYWYLLL